MRSGNTPEDVIRSHEDVAEIKAIAAQTAEDARQLELMRQGASAVPDLSKKIEADSILGRAAA